MQWAAAEQAGTRTAAERSDVMTAVEDRPVTAFEDNDQKPVGHGRMLRKEDPRFIRGKGHYVDDVQLHGHAAPGRSCARRWRTPGSSASTPARPRRIPR